MADRVGEQFGKYRLLRLLGKGGFAEVYLAEHVENGTQVALKVLHAVLMTGDVERFRSEAQIIASLSHPHIVRLLDFDTEQGTPFLVMEYASNGSLRERYQRGTALPVEQVVAYVKQVADALQYAHDQKLIHRDIKPENLLLGPGDQILLTDFGIATVAKSSHSQSTQDAMGTVTYMAPEQIQGKPRTASDQYALGIVAYEWLTGQPPFEGSFTEIATQHLFATPASLREKVPALPEATEQVVLIALAKDSHQRFASVSAFAHALEQASQGVAPVYFAPTQITPPSLADAPTVPTAFNRPSVAPSAPDASSLLTQAETVKTVPQGPETFTTLPALASTTPQSSGPPVRPGRTRGSRRLLSNALIGLLALLLIIGAGTALALSHHPQPGGSGSSLAGNTTNASSSGGSSTVPIVGRSATPTATFPTGPNGTPGTTSTPGPNGAPTTNPTNPPAPAPTPTPTLAPGPHPTITTDCGNLVTPWVAIYQFSNFGGRELCFEGMGLVNLGEYGFDKQTMSINIAANGAFFDQPNGEGNQLAFYYGDEQSDLGSWDDRISSFIVYATAISTPTPTPTPTPIPPTPHPTITTDCGNLVTPWVAIYQFSNFGGRELCFEGTGLINLADYGFDKETMSINIAANGAFFDQPNGQGNQLAFFYGDEQSDLGAWDNRISSFIVTS